MFRTNYSITNYTYSIMNHTYCIKNQTCKIWSIRHFWSICSVHFRSICYFLVNNAPSIFSQFFLVYLTSLYEMHKICKRATPQPMSNYNLSLLLYKSFHGDCCTEDWIDFNMNIVVPKRQKNFAIVENHNLTSNDSIAGSKGIIR